jgi:hypothetical protein
MRFRRLRRVIEGYRWLWRAQRRWRPGALWLSAVEFVARVAADMMLCIVPGAGETAMSSNRPLRSPLVLGAAVAACLLVVGVLTLRDRPSDVPPAAWRYAEGGFTIDLQAPWESARDDDVVAPLPVGAPVRGSAYRLASGGMLFPRFVTVQTYFLGEIGLVRDVVKSIGNWVRGPVVPLEVLRAHSGVLIPSYRFEDRDEELTQAAIVFRGRGGLAYAVAVTGRRRDEAVVLVEARRVAEAIRYDRPPVTDGEVAMAWLFDLPMDALAATRSMTFRNVELRDSAGEVFASMDLSEAESLEECRAGALVLIDSFWLPALGAVREFDALVTCPSSRIAMRVGTRAMEPSMVRQLDRTGTVVFESAFERGVTPRDNVLIVNGSRRPLPYSTMVVQTAPVSRF